MGRWADGRFIPAHQPIRPSASLAPQDLPRNAARADDRAVDRRVLAVRLGGFSRKEERPIQRGAEFLPRPAAAHGGITVGAARKRIGLPVVTESAAQALLHAYPIHLEE